MTTTRVKTPAAASVPAPPAAMTEEACRAAFDRQSPGTVGLEEELMLLDPESLDLVPAGARVLSVVPPDGRFRRELPASQVEIVTGVCADAVAAAHELADGRRVLSAATAGWLRLAGAGAHPFAAAVGEMSEGERYRRIAEEYGWAAVRGLVFGLHVHVAVQDADRALAVHNALRSYLPEIAVLAGNAPFFDGRDTGLASVRPKIAEALPRQGVPPAFASWADYAALLRWGAAGGMILEPRDLWWEVRLHPVFGTLEVRAPDTQTTVAETAAVAAVVQALAGWLARRHDDGERLPVHPRERIDENRWRALRHGLGGTLVDLDTGEPEPTRTRVRRLIEVLSPVAFDLGIAPALAHADSMALEGNGAERQRAVAADRGLEGLVAWLADRFEPGA